MYGDTAEMDHPEARIRHLNAVLKSFVMINEIISNARDRKDLLKDVCTALTSTRGYHNAWIILMDPDRTVTDWAQDGLGDSFQDLLSQIRRGTLTSCALRALDSHEPEIVSDPSTECSDCPLAASYSGRAGFAVRLDVGEKSTGLLAVSVPVEFLRDAGEHELFMNLARAVSQGVKRLRLEEIRQSQQRRLGSYERIISRISDPMALIDKDYRYTVVNDAYLKKFGKSREEIEGRTVADLLGTDVFLNQVRQHLDSALSGREVVYEDYFTGPGGSPEYHIVNYYPFHDGDVDKGVVVRTVDITPRKRKEQQEALRSELIAYASGNSLAGLMTKALDKIEQLLNSAIGFLHFVDPDQRTLTLQQWSTATRKRFCRASGHSLHYAIEKAGVWADCLRERKGLIHNDYAALPHRKGLPEGHAEVIREMVVPVIRQGAVVAIMGVGNKPVDYTREDLNTLSYLADVTWEVIARKLSDNALRESEEKHRRLFETMAQGVIYQAADGSIVSANPAAERILGLSFSGMIGKTSADPRWKMIREDGSMVPGAEHPAMKALQTGRRAGPVIRGVFHPDRDDHIWLSITAIPVFQPGDTKPCQAYAVFEDITDRRQAEKALHESEKKFRHLFEKAEEGILVARGETLEFVNPALEGILGHSMEKLTSEPFITFIHPDDRALALDRHQRRMRGEHLDRSVDFRVITPDGTVKWININNQVIDWEGSPANLGFVADITQRKQAEREQARLMSAIEQSTDVIVITDPEGAIQYVNPAFMKVTGYTREEAAGQNPSILKSGHQDDPFYQKLWSTITGGDTFRGRMVNKRKDGTLYTEYATISPVVDAKGRIVNFVAVKRDITEREKLQSQLYQARKMESVGRLAGGVAHDFNNKLAIINGYAEMAIDMIDPLDPLGETIREIHTAGMQSADIVRQLLAFARQQTISPVLLDLNDTISGMLKMLQRLIGENIDLTWNPGGNLWPVKIDPSQVDQVMANLAVNARDAIDDVGKLTIGTKNVVAGEDYRRMYPYFVPGKYVVLTVSDTGCGMDQEVKDHLFDPFFTTKGIGKGTGLGLSTIYGIVKQNGGFINVYSEPGQGSVFTIYFPAHEAAESSVSPLEASGRKIPVGSETILLVEDEPAILKMGKGMLERLGYTVFSAETPNDALRAASEYDGTIDLLITDVIMPEMNGRELSSQLSRSHHGLKTLYMSGYTADVIARHGVLDEGVQFIQKPFSMQDLAVKVRETIAADWQVSER